jgi:4-carboxymuconolactone decarboxylase
MTNLESRYQAAIAVLGELGRLDDEGRPQASRLFREVAPDQWRIIMEACFGSLWSRPALTRRQRSIVTIACIAVLRRDENLRGHIRSGLDVGLTPEEIVEVMLQLLFYVGAPITNTALGIADEVFRERGLHVEPARVYDATEDPEALHRRGLELRSRLLQAAESRPQPANQTARDFDRYVLEYVWGSVWSRPGLSLQERCLAVLAALATLGEDQALAAYAGAATGAGLTSEQVREVCFHLCFYVGVPRARRALRAVEGALAGG